MLCLGKQEGKKLNRECLWKECGLCDRAWVQTAALARFLFQGCFVLKALDDQDTGKIGDRSFPAGETHQPGFLETHSPLIVCSVSVLTRLGSWAPSHYVPFPGNLKEAQPVITQGKHPSLPTACIRLITLVG